MLINSWYRSQPALDDFQNESTATWIKASLFPNELYQHIYTSMYEWVGRSQRTKKKRQDVFQIIERGSRFDLLK